MRNTFGDLIEALAIFVMKSAGVDVKNEQKKVTYKFENESIEGRQDVEIDEKIWDIKSASPYSFDKKFGEAGGLQKLSKKIPLAMHRRVFCIEKVKKKVSVAG